MGEDPFTVGEVVVFKIPSRDIPIVHRVLEVHTREDGVQQILTKGDNNDSFDRPLYDGRTWITREQILGRVRGFLPYLGHITILLTEFPTLKILMLGMMGMFVLISNDG
jgi:signal peptidase